MENIYRITGGSKQGQGREIGGKESYIEKTGGKENLIRR